ncbi:ABC-2 type transport system ATP-binding protein [Planomicrobium stackebrandtii]|uniref:ABC-2 type transport system ATP-binding protein n=1 Tax=Planomicrobium stackebrandtii TaxID=253160 RepID=A0ABU0GWU5_9BACL|nr:ABC transporter ATP-binding protein [Planomicrobium stackebrandtii]MDQ0429399.1 ABC-2 type transport system ATP-binding protein [Planomicrobium stackebrandtii]
MPSWIEINALQKNMDDFQLGPISLTIEPGTITGLVGNNGSGKSTLLKLVMNLANADAGTIEVFGETVAGKDESWKQKLAFQPQKIIGWDAYTGTTLKEMISSLYGEWDEALFEQMVRLFDIPLDKRFGKMSQGMQQKLSLALALPRNTEVLILDEPTAFLDIPSKRHFMDLLIDWMDAKERAVIITSHQTDDLRKLADYLFVMRDGKAIGHFEKEALLESYRRYWLDGVPGDSVPGEVSRDRQQLVSEDPAAAEHYFAVQNITVIDHAALDLEEIIDLLLK